MVDLMRQRNERGEFVAIPNDCTMAYCPGCDRVLARNKFGGNRARHNGLQPRCKKCRRLDSEGSKRPYGVGDATEWLVRPWGLVNGR